MEYNTDRSKMIIPEYGRNIHRMVQYALNIEDRKKRNKCSWGIVKVMGDLNPHLRDVPDFQHKLWDQLFIMSDFKLDVDSPFPKPEPEQFQKPPEKIPYPEALSDRRYYGKIIRSMIEIAINCLEADKREGIFYAIANTMKKNYLKWNKDTVEDDVILKDLKELSQKGLGIIQINGPLLSVENILYSSRKKKSYSFHTSHNKKKKFNNNGDIYDKRG